MENQLAEVVRLLENSKLKDSAASAQMSQTPSSSRCGAFRLAVCSIDLFVDGSTEGIEGTTSKKVVYFNQLNIFLP